MLIYDLLESFEKLTYGLVVLNGIIVSVVTYQLVKNGELERRLDRLENIENSRMARVQDNWDRARVRDSDIMLDADD
jgi:hypothetical protein